MLACRHTVIGRSIKFTIFLRSIGLRYQKHRFTVSETSVYGIRNIGYGIRSIGLRYQKHRYTVSEAPLYGIRSIGLRYQKHRFTLS